MYKFIHLCVPILIIWEKIRKIIEKFIILYLIFYDLIRTFFFNYKKVYSLYFLKYQLSIYRIPTYFIISILLFKLYI